jgi:hypothetical protein
MRLVNVSTLRAHATYYDCFFGVVRLRDFSDYAIASIGVNFTQFSWYGFAVPESDQ